jgi:ubiquinone/menaquinone biosynthesis C-methylase UbiE
MHASARSYTPLVLKLYDFIVLGFANTFCWRCPTKSVLLPFFKQPAGQTSHLDEGVGTGYYLVNSLHVLAQSKITLADLNPNTLNTTTNRLIHSGCNKANIHEIVHDVFTPLPGDLQGSQDAISLFYLLHCLPGRMSDKAPEVFKHLSPALKPEGTLYGATGLGKPLPSWWMGRRWLKFVNGKGDLDNYNDTEEDLRAALEEYFEDVEVRVVGQVALFVGKKPRPQKRND